MLLPSGALLLDTPGMRELGLVDADAGLEAAFEDIEALAASCRFGDCTHRAEPGCAVQAALEARGLDPDRWRGFQKLQRELTHVERKDDHVARKAQQKLSIAHNKAQRAQRKLEKRR